MNPSNTNRLPIGLLAAFIVLLLAAFTTKPLLLGTTRAVTLPKAPALTGQIGQALAKSSTTVPQAPGDFTLQQTQYFVDNEWAVANIKGTKGTANTGWVVLHQQNGFYQVVLGPGTALPDSYVSNLPPAVSGYLYQQGIVYGSGE